MDNSLVVTSISRLTKNVSSCCCITKRNEIYAHTFFLVFNDRWPGTWDKNHKKWEYIIKHKYLSLKDVFLYVNGISCKNNCLQFTVQVTQIYIHFKKYVANRNRSTTACQKFPFFSNKIATVWQTFVQLIVTNAKSNNHHLPDWCITETWTANQVVRCQETDSLHKLFSFTYRKPFLGLQINGIIAKKKTSMGQTKA